jgi:small conductance mechanosensitive channel
MSTRGIERRVRNQIAAGLVPFEQTKHWRLVVQAGEWGAVGITYFVALIVILVKFKLPLASLVAPATVVGVGLGFGAQKVVQDLLAGLFLFTERQYGFGDLVRIGTVGSSSGVTGTIEEVTLRTTSLRTIDGELVVIPNGQIPQATNLSRGWARAVIDVPLGLDVNVDLVTALLENVGMEMMRDDRWKAMLLEAPSVVGVQAIQVGYLQLRVMARTVPAAQFDVGREIRRRSVEAFRDAGIPPPPAMLAAQPPPSGS